MARPRKASDQSSTVSVSLRVDPAIKYAIDIAARVQKRTVTGVVEWSVEKALDQVMMPADFLVEGNKGPALPEPISVIKAVKEKLWSPDEAIRLVTLAFQYPSLLAFDESIVWESIRLSPPFWKFTPRVLTEANPWRNARLDVISSYWETLLQRIADAGGIVQVSYEDVGLPTPLELEERKAKAITESDGFYQQMAIESENLRRQNEALHYLTDQLFELLKKVDPEKAKSIKGLPPLP
ncbi:hypothetical protein [Pseudomonas abietaniphila]|uniref:Uncharacterized protein n=1 Tax=Pseudomonas abietaniphila TaxID=89065 RepID=A0A1G8NGC0_9PSED|nr:hypothetical protein [Pseudomonas abietaniphila]SDI79137.1 hypothetical protein SAMN05216605_11772 [Pseudomonas abietaniphila]